MLPQPFPIRSRARRAAPLWLCGAALGALSLPASAAVPRVVADITPVQSLVARVMQGLGEPGLILPPGASPHDHAMRPSEAQALDGADLVFWVGPALEPWMEKPLTSLAGDARIVPLLDSPGTEVLPVRQGASFEKHEHGDGHAEHGDEAHDHAADGEEAHDDAEEPHDHAAHSSEEQDRGARAEGARDPVEHAHELHDHAADAGGADANAHADAEEVEGHDHADETAHDHDHGHDGRDPHAWLDPDNARVWLDVIAGTLSEMDPHNAAAYAANAAAGKAELATLDGQLKAELAPLASMPFIVFHDAYQYFEAHFGLNAAGSISLADGAAPGPARLKEVQDKARSLHVSCAFREPQFDPKLIETVFEGQDVNIEVLDPLGATLTPGPQLYPDLLRQMAAAFTACHG
ncbi:zinc transporter [Paracoccus suum]|uniref:High-affinity zinc uptake system protein ZnuA n=1 Tax=Paracoccus suum TaxID=2259340 RepID=A0A344PJX7_9RHOB|nr:zinc ABC transporter substrate-binding protein [Paracoccus suum]AXC49682.1 zinc transporter [Paracoccus suum]